MGGLHKEQERLQRSDSERQREKNNYKMGGLHKEQERLQRSDSQRWREKNNYKMGGLHKNCVLPITIFFVNSLTKLGIVVQARCLSRDNY